MGLGNFRNRILIASALIFVLWQSSKLWSPYPSDSSPESYEVNHQVVASTRPDQKAVTVQKVHVTVYYEALCPDSRSFFAKQLLPTYERISENMELELIPYGKAKTIKTKDGYEFKCQHEYVECEANIIHACSIDTIKDSALLLRYLTCMIKKNLEPQAIMQTCAEKMNIDYQPILECYKTDHGKELLAMYGEITNRNGNKITFIPTITLDQSFDKQPAILKNLLQQVCLLLTNKPKGCFQ